MIDILDAQQRAAHAVRSAEPHLRALATALYADPEISFDEVRSARRVTEVLVQYGFSVTEGVGGLPTAFTATAGSGPFVVAFCAEYDALPGVGHACGHPIIAGSAIGAAIGLAAVADDLGVTVTVVGCPAEEHGAGKAVLLDAGVFDDASISLMLHPMPQGYSANPAGTTSQAAGRFRATFSGRAAHAAAAPHLGRNAGDAAVLAQVAIGLLRQQLPDGVRVGSLVVSGGAATNIIPETAVVDFECRSVDLDEYRDVERRLRLCFEAAALATETQVEIVATEPLYEPLVQHETLSAYWSEAISHFGFPADRRPLPGLASTDMGNVSQRVPSIHPWLPLPAVTAPIHSHDFAAQAATAQAHEAMLHGATALAWTAISAALDPDLIAARG